MSTRLNCTLKSEFDPTTLNDSFQTMNGDGFPNSVKMVQLYNPSTTISIEISLDGINPHSFIPPMGTLILDCQSNHDSAPTNTGTLNVSEGQILYGRVAPNPTFFQMIGYY